MDKILIVDDETFNVDFLEQEIEDLGYETLSAYNGAQALEIVASASPDLVLLDIMMPVMNGFDVLKHLKDNPATRDIPVIVISALNDIQSIVRCIESGAEDFLPKPFNDILLKARIQSSLQKRHWRIHEKMYLQQIETEKKRVDELLHVILPDPIVSELKGTDQVIPRDYPSVAVLFADVVNFTQYCDQHSPQEVLSNLQALVVAYEELALKYNLQKIKTIGDAFMAAGGLLHPLENPVLNCLRCGQEMILAASRLPANWQMRIGVHCGSVMAGVVGKRQYLFDIWGDTVNTAQRIESHGTPGSVNLSRAAWEQVSDLVQAEPLGLIEVKGKGLLEIFHVCVNVS